MRVSEGRRGDDYTKGYSAQTTFIEFSKGSKVIKFKPFLKSFSINRRYNKKRGQTITGFYEETTIQYDTEKPVYNISFTVPSNSVNEAIIHHGYVQHLMRMVAPPNTPGNKHQTLLSGFYVKIANLMSDSSILGGGGMAALYMAKENKSPSAAVPNAPTNAKKAPAFKGEHYTERMYESGVTGMTATGQGVTEGKESIKSGNKDEINFRAQPGDPEWQNISGEYAEAKKLSGVYDSRSDYNVWKMFYEKGWDVGDEYKRGWEMLKGERVKEREKAVIEAQKAGGDYLVEAGRMAGIGDPLLVYSKKVTYKPVIEMGFFEHQGMLFAKTFEITMALEVGTHDDGTLK